VASWEGEIPKSTYWPALKVVEDTTGQREGGNDSDHCTEASFPGLLVTLNAQQHQNDGKLDERHPPDVKLGNEERSPQIHGQVFLGKVVDMSPKTMFCRYNAHDVKARRASLDDKLANAGISNPVGFPTIPAAIKQSSQPSLVATILV